MQRLRDSVRAWLSRKDQVRLIKSIPEVPETFTEKVRFRMAFDRRPILEKFADKYHVRDYVKAKVGAQYLAEILDVATRPEEIDWGSLPKNFVSKTNHGSGGMIGVWTGVEMEAQLPRTHRNLGWTRWWVHPENFHLSIAQSMMRYWLQRNFAYRKDCFPEWAYASVRRRVYVEELLVNRNGTIASPFSFYVFDGETKVIRVSGRGRDSSRFHRFVDRNWKPLDVGIGTIDREKLIDPFPGRLENWDDLLSVAETLAGTMDFVRVDLYNIDGRIVFSELTNYPSAGTLPWVPAHFEYSMGRHWNLVSSA